MNEGSVSLACASLLADELSRAGVTAACISPGSRSTPLVLAFARDPRFEMFVHLDERASAFFALGRARATGVPVAVVCTSGTAAANLFPAIVEASMARVPLIVLTADRPHELRNTGANQTIDQVELYGKYARAFIEPSLPSAATAPEWRDAGARAAVVATGPPAGPVHVNCAFREPLIPDGSPPEMEIPAARGERNAQPAFDLQAVPTLIEQTERGVLVAGGLARGDDVVELARVLGWPLIAEPLSGARVPGIASAAGQALLMDETFARAHAPDVVLQFGSTPVTRATLGFVASASDLVVIDPDGWPADPARAATHTVRADARALLGALQSPRDASAWLKEWSEADDAARGAIDRAVDAIEEPFEGRIARDLAATLPSGATLVVGSSMPVRDLDMFMAPRDGLRVLANRGASGIDGLVSTALGVASVAPTYVLCGDLTLLHDIGSLVWSARRGFDATFVVLNNNGGGIFDLLPSAALSENDALFVTPHGFSDLRAITEAAGARYTRVGRARELPDALGSPKGAHVIEVPIDRARALGHRAAIRRAVAEALG